VSDTQDQHSAPNSNGRPVVGPDYRIAANSPWGQAWKMAAVVGVIGLLVGGFGYTLDPRRFAFSYLMGLVTVLTMALGSVFFVLIQHLTGAGWSVTVRRTSEFFVAGLVIVPLLALPALVLGPPQLFPWWGHQASEGVAHAQAAGGGRPERHGRVHEAASTSPVGEQAAVERHEDEGAEHAIEERVLTGKMPFLNTTFFYIRAVLYLLAWLWLSDRLFRYSTAQDKTGDPQWTVKLQGFAPRATMIFALSLTFAGFDWVMSLEPTWYSTMFGVRVFASSAVLGLALNILVALGLRRSGVSGNAISVEHLHDLGKLMFGFLVFWAYISFSEFFLIWYAAIPEETIYYHLRWDSQSWRMISISLVCVKFIIPFFLIMSRNVKRNPGVLGLGAAWIVSLHLVEMYYWVMPYYAGGGELPFSATGLMTDVGCVLGCVGIYLAVVFRRMLNHPVIPVRDPRLSRALRFVNA
jgi:hypothetical protein